jgi:hypothetical protein
MIQHLGVVLQVHVDPCLAALALQPLLLVRQKEASKPYVRVWPLGWVHGASASHLVVAGDDLVDVANVLQQHALEVPLVLRLLGALVFVVLLVVPTGRRWGEKDSTSALRRAGGERTNLLERIVVDTLAGPHVILGLAEDIVRAEAAEEMLARTL